MTHLFYGLPSMCGLPIHCAYRNQTPTIQIIRSINIPNWYFERVVFPGEQLVFKLFTEFRYCQIAHLHVGFGLERAHALLRNTIRELSNNSC